MKKYLLALLSMALFVGVVKAESVIPSPKVTGTDNSDYGGFKVSTHAFGYGAAAAGVNFSTASFSGPGVLADVFFSTGNTFDIDFVEVWDSTTVTFANNNTLIGRFYNLNQYSVFGTSIAAGSAFGTSKPRQFSKGLLMKPSTNKYNMINLLYYTK